MYFVATDNKGHFIKDSLSKDKSKADFVLAGWKRKQAFQNLKPIALESYTNLSIYIDKVNGEVIQISKDKFLQLKQPDIFNKIWID